ncbi:hypothetical protein AMECASPLE_007347 [Ameca splendens]|uniref:Uncharacterized protein n=1 Tax=Ameca splendens TaxID=208324 RepID=A0ABV0YLS5_9TELE
MLPEKQKLKSLKATLKFHTIIHTSFNSYRLTPQGTIATQVESTPAESLLIIQKQLMHCLTETRTALCYEIWRNRNVSFKHRNRMQKHRIPTTPVFVPPATLMVNGLNLDSTQIALH